MESGHTSGDNAHTPKQRIFLSGRYMYLQSLAEMDTHQSETRHNSETRASETTPLTPKTKGRLNKIKSEEDFVKFQVPWIM